ncbi:HAD family hydrolase [Myceligenerans salitolerans]|uniref:HAD hydrolase family protein n=1 Tax=Myceligenerans salitolerans TaxID=1230528 RepID=A0ABS3IBX6_9MICO|nr:HAD hydrolase family protein [Myceligenerans salitolerans]MBO0609899.1 HAD hydrolase family protein [Myceligenerans salitolerans]
MTRPTAKNTSKAAALEQGCLTIGIDRDATIGVGDGLNDLPAFAWAATAVAMGQASDQLLAAADLVTAPVDQHGAAHVLHALAVTR